LSKIYELLNVFSFDCLYTSISHKISLTTVTATYTIITAAGFVYILKPTPVSVGMIYRFEFIAAKQLIQWFIFLCVLLCLLIKRFRKAHLQCVTIHFKQIIANVSLYYILVSVDMFRSIWMDCAKIALS